MSNIYVGMKLGYYIFNVLVHFKDVRVLEMLLNNKHLQEILKLVLIL